MKIVQWALWSNRNAVVAGAAVVVLIAALSFGLATITPDKRARPEAARAETSAQGSSSASPTAFTDAQGVVIARARTFTSTWLDTSDGWWTRVQPLVAPELAPAMQMTNLDEIPDASVQDVKVVTESATAAQAVVSLTDGSQVTLGLGKTGGQWKVVSLLPGDGS